MRLKYACVVVPALASAPTASFVYPKLPMNSQWDTVTYRGKSQPNRHHSVEAAMAKSKASGGGGFGGGGFGGTAKNSKRKSVKPVTDGKVRVVSGYTGSGTKPLRVAANTFDSIRKKYQKEGTSDVVRVWNLSGHFGVA